MNRDLPWYHLEYQCSLWETNARVTALEFHMSRIKNQLAEIKYLLKLVVENLERIK